MTTNHQVHRRSHEALLRKRRLVEEPGTGAVKAVVEEAAGNERRQFDDLPSFTDIFPGPGFPDRPERPDRPGRPRTTSTEELPTEETPVTIVRPPVTTSTPIIPVVPTTAVATPTPVVVPRTTSSTPTTSSTSTTPAPVVAPRTTTSPVPQAVTTPEPIELVTVTSWVRSSSAKPSASGAAANGVVEPAGGSKAGPIAGAVFGALFGLGAIAVLVVFLLRRRRKQKNDQAFDPADFRRSAMLVPEPPMQPNSGSAGFDVPPSGPPQMMERQLPMTPNYGGAPVPLHHDYGYNNQQMSPPPSSGYGNNPGYFDNAYADPAGPNMAGYGSGNTAGAGTGGQAWGPGQVVPMAAHYAANPFMNPAPYNESPFDPAQTPVSAHTPSTPPSRALTRTPSSASHYPVGFPKTSVRSTPSSPIEGDANPITAGTVLAQIGGAAVLTRGASQKSTRSNRSNKSTDLSIAVPTNPAAANTVPVNYPEVPPLPTADASKRTSETIPANDYVDLTRASVSPFQAAQYAEISKRLNTDAPTGMAPPMVEQYIVKGQDRDLPPLPPPSPLTAAAPSAAALAPAPAPPVPADAPPIPAETVPASPQAPAVRDSVDSMASLANTRGVDFADQFPIPPPSPLFAAHTSPTRIDSRPPMLPEIAFQSRVSVGSYNAIASSHGHEMTYDYHKSYSGPPLTMAGLNSPGGDIGPAFPSGISALGGLASPMNRQFNLTVPALPKEASTPKPSVEAQGVTAGDETGGSTDLKKTASQVERTPSKKAEIVAGKRPETLYDPEDAYGGI